MTGVDVEHTKAQLADMRRQMEYARFMRVSTGRETAWKLLAKAESLVAAVERVQAQVDTALEILDHYNHSEGYDLPECAPEDRWRLYRDLLATLNPEAMETKP
ncbi:hypothetical protein [Rhodococcus erythropolis]|uniref:hypothetical protein n=1 Tax=Rhodococcus erythropolis TaxID=1833 RepID=UPI002226AFBA|nr:hypothetical protein [Rhodococcus erythropolis]MCW2300619.1 hypothetical protein [Rhodococcus erythropolis]